MALNFPNSPGIGSVYTDTTSGFSWQWDGTVWKSYAAASSSNIKIIDNISSSFNGVTQTFSLTTSGVAITPVYAQSLIVNLGGVVQNPSSDYSVSGSQITFSDPPAAGLSFSAVSLGPAVPISYANDGNIYVRNTYTGAGTTGPFTFSQGYTVGYLDVYRNGVRLRSGTDFTATSGNNFYLTDAASVGDELEAIGYSVASFVSATSNLTNLNVTGFATVGNLNVTGICTYAGFNVSGVSTLTNLIVSGGSSITNLLVSGVSTFSGIATYLSSLFGTQASFTGVVTASSFSGNLTGTATGLSGTPNITVGNIVGSALTITGISTFSTVGIRTASPIQPFQFGSGASSVVIDTLGEVGIGTTNPTSLLQVTGGDSRFGGVIETVSAATTYMSGSAMVLEMDVRQATTYTYTIPTGANIGIVSFKNMPAQTGRASGTTITCIFTQNAAGTGNTTATAGIGTNITVVGYENGAAVAGITTRALVGGGTTVTLSTTANDRDFVSFFINYTGATNTTASSYQVYTTKNGSFR